MINIQECQPTKHPAPKFPPALRIGLGLAIIVLKKGFNTISSGYSFYHIIHCKSGRGGEWRLYTLVFSHTLHQGNFPHNHTLFSLSWVHVCVCVFTREIVRFSTYQYVYTSQNKSTITRFALEFLAPPLQQPHAHFHYDVTLVDIKQKDSSIHPN